MKLTYIRKYIEDGKTWVTLANESDTWDELASDWEYVIDLCGSINGGNRVASYYRAKDGRIAFEG